MKHIKFKMSTLLGLLFCNVLISQVNTTSNSWNDFDSYIKTHMKDWNIPGMAIAVVKGDSIMVQNTYGYANIESNVLVTKNTLFPIGSCTKFFTTTAMSILADEGKLNFNDPVIKYYPELKLADTILQNQVTITDILSHRTGLERGDYIWYGSNYSRQDILNRLTYLKNVAPIRSAFVYNNMMYTLAGTIIEKQSGDVYEDYVTKKLFNPLKMNNTAFDIQASKSPVALPYRLFDSKYDKLSMPLLKGVEPAGGIWSDVVDMTKWLKFNLSNGKSDTTQIVSRVSAYKLKTPVHIVGAGMPRNETEFKSYGLGMGFTAYKGYRVMYHTGVAGGYTAHMAFLPEENVGVILLINTETFTTGLIYNIFDRVLNLEQSDDDAQILPMVKQQWQQQEAEEKEEQSKMENAKNIADANKFVGIYQNPICQPIKIFKKGSKLFCNYNTIEYQLRQTENNQLIAYDGRVLGEIKLDFDLNDKNNVIAFNLTLLDQELKYIKIQ